MKKNFVAGVLKPAYDIYQMSNDGNKEGLKTVVSKLGIKISEETWLLSPKELSKAILEKWLPVEKAVLDMVVKFLPSPIKAVKPISVIAAISIAGPSHRFPDETIDRYIQLVIKASQEISRTLGYES